MSLEDVPRIIEHDSGEVRNPEKYYFSVFGLPSDTAPWAYRIEGHHLSQNYTIVKGKVIDGPSFFRREPCPGPPRAAQGPAYSSGGRRPWVPGDKCLDEQQQKTPIVDPTAYREILTAASRKAVLQGQPSGVSAAKMNQRQFDALSALKEECAQRVTDEVAGRRIEQINQAGRNVFFAWSGGVNPGDLHYYRVQTPCFLIDMDDTQDNANHIHSVWRDFTGDFGEDLLHEHYRTSHLGTNNAHTG